MKKQNKNKFCGSFGKIYFCFVFLFSVFYFLFSGAVYAQFELPNIGSVKSAIILNSDPLTPLPNSTIAITANLSVVTGAGGSNYAWFLNGARQAGASGLNKNTFAFRTGAIGTVYRVSVNVVMPNGENLSDAINLTVSDADLTWITDSKAPIFYLAKLMPTQNSVVTVSALPFIYRPETKNLIASSNLTYNWIVDGKMDSEKSGKNKFSYVFRVDNFPGNSYLIRLEIKTEDGAVSLNKYVTIPVIKPQIMLHFSDPKTGLPYGAALKNLMVKPISLNFTAETYFFTAPAKNLKWHWFINNAEVGSETENPWLATLNLANDFIGAFSTQIKVTAQNPANELEMAQSITNLEIK